MTDSKSSYVDKFGDNEEVTLKEGKNEIKIKLKAGNGDIKTYTLNIIREGLVKEEIVSDITINNYEINFNKDVLEYDVKINDETTLSINVVLGKPDYSYQVVGNDNLTNGSVITISATGDNETIEDKFNIIKKIIVDNEEDVNNNENNENNKNNYITYLSIGFLVTSIVILISSIIYGIWRNKKVRIS